MTAAEKLLTLALEMAEDGSSLIPVGNNKKPFMPWKEYQNTRAGADQLQRWAADPRTAGFAVVCGRVSGGLEIQDFDDPNFYTAFMAAAPAWAAELPAQKTGGGGYQVAYRRQTPGGNIKLAWATREADADGVVIEGGREIAIETRGEGGYAVIPHSLHPSGNRYAPLTGTFGNIPTIDDAQAAELLALARGMDQTPKPQPQEAPQRPAAPRVDTDATGPRAYVLGGIQKELEKVAAARQGERNAALFEASAALGNLIEAFHTPDGGGRELVSALSESDARALLTEAAQQQGGDDRDTLGQIQDTISSGLEKGKQTPRDVTGKGEKKKAVKVERIAPQKATKAPTGRYRMPTFPKGTQEGTDEANAVILAANGLGDRLRYSLGLGWYVYQTVGTWERDTEMTMAAQVAGEVLREVVGQYFADAMKQRADKEELQRIGRWASAVCNVGTVKGALTAAAGKPEFLTAVDAWNARPDLLNCRNGVLELTTGNLRPHAPDDLMTWQAGAAYDPAAQHPYVNDLLELLRADGRYDFIQRTVGSTLYGEAPNEVFTVLQGEGGTGKGTLTDAVVAMLGDYAYTTEVEMLLQSARGESGGGPKPELLKLQGKRLVIAGEPPKGARFNAGRVKGMTGNDPITARTTHSPVMVTFTPVFKLWIHTNYPIGAAHDDTGLQRRIRVVPFTAKPSTPDLRFKDTLKKDPQARAALLNWALEGCRLWLTSGYSLGESEAVKQATGGYWTDQNPYEKFAAQRLAFDAFAEITSASLRAAFENWAEENGIKMGRAVKLADLYAYLGKLGARSQHTRNGNVWVGVELSVNPVNPVNPNPEFFTHTRVYKQETGGEPSQGSQPSRDDVHPGQVLAPASGEL